MNLLFLISSCFDFQSSEVVDQVEPGERMNHVLTLWFEYFPNCALFRDSYQSGTVDIPTCHHLASIGKQLSTINGPMYSDRFVGYNLTHGPSTLFNNHIRPFVVTKGGNVVFVNQFVSPSVNRHWQLSRVFHYVFFAEQNLSWRDFKTTTKPCLPL